MTSQPAVTRQFQLPNLSTAPDVYETGGGRSSSLSGRSTSPNDSASDTASTSSDSDEDHATTSGHGVSRRRLYPERARTRFGAQSRGVESRGVDLSDRVDGRRKGLTRRKSGERRGGTEEEEGLEARIARLRREVEECRVEAQEERERGGDGEDGGMGYLEELGRMMGDLEIPRRQTASESGGESATAPPTATTTPRQPSTDTTSTSEQTLTSISAFDTRLAALESALGLSSLDSTTTADSLSTPLLPTLTLLDQQLAALSSSTSLSALEAASSRIQKLKAEAAQLSHLQTQRTVPPTGSGSTPTSSELEEDNNDNDEADPKPTPLNPTDLQTLQSLHTLLPTLQSLHPLIPALTTRLRSLRTLHTTAATAAADLDAIEKRQVEMEAELKMWRGGLEKVEDAVEEAGKANGRNAEVVKGWVEELRGRVEGLRR